MNVAKIQLSADELALVQNADLLLTKNRIIKKVYHLFGELAHEIQGQIMLAPGQWPAEVLAAAPKIAKGENYGGLPYVMLDYPRYFSKTDVFAIRTFFWWGNFFSITLHLKGEYKRNSEEILKKNIAMLAAKGFYICISDDEWRHDFGEDNYRALQELDASSVEKILSTKDFCKLSVRMSLQRWNEAKEWLIDLYHVALNALDC